MDEEIDPPRRPKRTCNDKCIGKNDGPPGGLGVRASPKRKCSSRKRDGPGFWNKLLKRSFQGRIREGPQRWKHHKRCLVWNRDGPQWWRKIEKISDIISIFDYIDWQTALSILIEDPITTISVTITIVVTFLRRKLNN